jgi:hypothetical protein
MYVATAPETILTAVIRTCWQAVQPEEVQHLEDWPDVWQHRKTDKFYSIPDRFLTYKYFSKML